MTETTIQKQSLLEEELDSIFDLINSLESKLTPIMLNNNLEVDSVDSISHSSIMSKTTGIKYRLETLLTKIDI